MRRRLAAAPLTLAMSTLGAEPSQSVDAIPVLGVASIFHAGYLMRCIRSIDFEVHTLVVVHNGRDSQVARAIETLQQERPAMLVVRVPENSGCAGGWNHIIASRSSSP
eukprot:827230-Prymnesium_polylepis.1